MPVFHSLPGFVRSLVASIWIFGWGSHLAAFAREFDSPGVVDTAFLKSALGSDSPDSDDLFGFDRIDFDLVDFTESGSTDATWIETNGVDHPADRDSPTSFTTSAECQICEPLRDDFISFGDAQVGYDQGFVIATRHSDRVQTDHYPFRLRINGWGQLRHTYFDSHGDNSNVNQFQLKRGRLIFSGSAFTDDFEYYIQLDGRSSSGDDLRLLDFVLTYDWGHHRLGAERGVFGFKTGKYKMPFTLARSLSGREFEFSDRSVASTFFDVNRSLAFGLFGTLDGWHMPWNWEVAIFNGLVTGGAETGSSGNLDDNFAYAARIHAYPTGDWGRGEMADFQYHRQLATRIGAAYATSTIDRSGVTEFSSSRVVDSGQTLSTLLPLAVSQYDVGQFSLDASCKYRGWSSTFEYYFRMIDHFEGAPVDDLYDHGFWFQVGKFVVPQKLQLLSRWSRVVGDSGTLGNQNQSSDEIALGLAWYVRDQHAKVVADVTRLDGAPINSPALGIVPGDNGWLYRTQIQFAF